MTSPLGNKLKYPEAEARIISAKFTIPVGGEAARHTHPAPFYGYLMEGNLTAIYDDRKMKTFMAGEAYVESASDPLVRTVNLDKKTQ